MKLFLVHLGFYDQSISNGFYESHTNYFIAAEDVKNAKAKVKELSEYKSKRMHIDGIKLIESVGNYNIVLEKSKSINDNSQFSYDDVKEI